MQYNLNDNITGPNTLPWGTPLPSNLFKTTHFSCNLNWHYMTWQKFMKPKKCLWPMSDICSFARMMKWFITVKSIEKSRQPCQQLTSCQPTQQPHRMSSATDLQHLMKIKLVYWHQPFRLGSLICENNIQTLKCVLFRRGKKISIAIAALFLLMSSM